MINRLKTLYELQIIDEKLDELEELRGDLPNMVNELNSKIEGLKNQIAQKKEEQSSCTEKIMANEEEAEKIRETQKKFKAQLFQVRNNKEYDALTKEIDHNEELASHLELENKTLEDQAQKMKIEADDIAPQLESLKEDLQIKEAELKDIIKVNEKEEAVLLAKRNEIEAKTKKPDYAVYMRIRKAKGGVAVSTIKRTACSGCHNVVPPQRQLEIRQNRKLYNCEYCGRILVSAEIADSFNE